MAGYLVAKYRITNPQGYEAYVPAVIPTLAGHGVEVLAADYNSEALEGEPPEITVILKFASKEAVRNWYNSLEYQKIMHFRTDNSEGDVVIADGYVPQ